MRGLAPLLAALAIGGCAPANLLTQVNTQVNGSMVYAEDAAQYGVSDKWVPGCPAKGDCEDFALCKAGKLLAAGVSATALKLVVVEHRSGYHAVLQADGWVLDNLASAPVPAESDLRRRVYGCTMAGEKTAYVRRLNGPGWVELKAGQAAPKCAEAMAKIKRQAGL